jgi:hypothetical protein
VTQYFFDILYAECAKLDEIGIDCETPAKVQELAVEALPSIK